MNKQKFTAQIEVQAIISQAQKELAKLGKDVNKSWQDGSPPKSMLKQLESMRTRLTSLQNLTSKGVIDSSGLSSAKNDFNSHGKRKDDFKGFTHDVFLISLSPRDKIKRISIAHTKEMLFWKGWSKTLKILVIMSSFS